MTHLLSVGLPDGMYEIVEVMLITLLVAAVVPIITSIFKVGFIPPFIFELIVGIILGKHVLGIIHGQAALDGFRIIGLVFLIFLSGLDIDFDVVKKDREFSKFKIVRHSLMLFAFILLTSAGISTGLYYLGYLKNIYLGTILLAATFAGVVVPLIHQVHIHNSLIGQLLSTIALISEAFSLIALSIFMVFYKISDSDFVSLALMLATISLVFLAFKKFRKFINMEDISGGMVHIGMRWTIVMLVGLVIFADRTGGEYILGAFICGAVIKYLRPSHEFEENLKSIGFGIFIPFYFVIIGSRLDIMLLTDGHFLLLTAGVMGIILLAKLPLLYLLRWFKLGVIIPSIFLISSTLVVSFTAVEFGEELGIIDPHFGEAVIWGSIFIIILCPLIFEIFFPAKRYRENDKGHVYKSVMAKELVDTPHPHINNH